MSPGPEPAGSVDIPTLLALAIVAYIVANVLHEAVGHGGSCLALGCDPLIVTTAYFDGDSSRSSDLVRRLIAAGGTVVNAVAGLGLWWLLRRATRRSGALRCFLWLSMTVNLLVAAGYPLFSGVIGVGDWVTVVEGMEPAGAWQAILILSGVVLYVAVIALSLRELAHLIGGGSRDAVRRLGVKLTVLPYLCGSVFSTLGSVLNPIGAALVVTSAAAHFGGTSALAWMAQLLGTKFFRSPGGEPIRVARSGGWIAIAAIMLALHVAVLGPGIGF